MTLCLNPNCPKPENPDRNLFCQNCGGKLRLENDGDRTQSGCYRAIAQIGAGGFSKTYLAVDESQPGKPRCIIKQFRPQQTSSQGDSTRFAEEVQRLTAIGNHPQIPSLLGAFERGDRQYVVQKFIEGQNLGQELKEIGTFPEISIRKILEEVLLILHFIHDCRLIHRDIKPENIIRSPGNKKLVLVDFGAAKYATDTALAKVGTLIGSAEYTAPEQLRGKPTFASDLYSLGITCIHLLTNMPPFDLYDSLEGGWVWRDYLLQPVSDRLANILDKMLLETLRQRYHSAAEVLKDLNPNLKIETLSQSKINKGKVVMVSQPPPSINPPVETRFIASSGSAASGSAASGSAASGSGEIQPSTIHQQSSTINQPTWKCVQTIATSSQVNAIAFSVQSRTIASGGWDGTVKLWDIATGELLQTLSEHRNGVLSIAIATDGQTLASASADYTLKIWRLWQLSPKDLRDRTAAIATHTLIAHTSIVTAVAISPDRQTIASGSRDNTVKLWNLTDGQLRHTLTAHRDRITCVAFNPKWATPDPERSHILATASADGSILIIASDTGELKYEITGHAGAVESVAISPDGNSLIGSSWDRTIKIWQLPDDSQSGNFPQLKHTFCPHVLPAVAIAIHPDSTLFATGSHDATIKLWNLATAEPLATLRGHSMGVTSVAFSPDGKTLASGSQDGMVKLWRCE